MNWTRHLQCKDRFCWKCQNRKCTKFQARKSIRTGSVFCNSNIPLQKWVHALYLWSERSSARFTSKQLNYVCQLYGEFREICTDYFAKNPIKLGRPGIIVQIDESCFSHKVKFHHGRPPSKQLWVFGLVDTSTNPGVGFMQIVERRDEATLLTII